jgi:hypothetical protein
MKFDSIEYILPAHWSSAIINNDVSGLELNDIDLMEFEQWFAIHLKEFCNGHWSLDTQNNLESFLSNNHDAFEVIDVACDCFTYVFNKEISI